MPGQPSNHWVAVTDADTMLKFTVKNRATGDEQSYQLRQNVIIFGRSPKCDVVLASATVSRQHAQIVTQKGRVEIEDLGSGNGTLLNQVKIETGKRVPLKAGDQLRMEEFDILIDPSTLPQTAERSEDKPVTKSISEESITKFEITDPEMVEVKMIKKILGALDNDKRPCVFVTGEPFQNSKAYIENEEQEFFVGRDPECELTLDSPVISRKHAKIAYKWGGFVITDLGSKNKTFVNGEEIEEKTLHDGDEILFGTIKAIFKNPQEFSIEAISKSIGEENKKQETTNITRVIEKQELPSDQAKMSVGEPQKKSVEETAIKGKPKKTEKSKEENKAIDQKNKTEEPESPAVEKSVTQTQKTGLLSGLSLSEKLLLVFGVLLLAGLVWVLRYILQ